MTCEWEGTLIRNNRKKGRRGHRCSVGEGRKEGVPAGTEAGRRVSAQKPPSSGKVPGAAACSRSRPGCYEASGTDQGMSHDGGWAGCRHQDISVS